MKLTLKFGLAFLLGLTLVLTYFAWATLQRETDSFWADMRRDNLVTAKMVAAAISQLGAQPGSEAARELLQRAREVESPVRIRWVSLDTPTTGPGVNALRPDELESLRSGNVITSTSSARRDAGDLLTYVPVAIGGEAGAIEVAEPLAEVNRYTRETLFRIATTTATLIAVCGAMFVLIGTRLVGRPVNQLVNSFRHAALGNLAFRPSVSQRDELGMLAREFGVLCDRLAEARERAADEEAKRLAALEQLRHADRLRTVGQLTAGVAHELGTPLNVVWARASMIARGEVAADDAVHCARIIEDQSQRMTSIIRRLLEFARPRPPQKSRADLRQIVRQTIEVLEVTARKRGVTLTAEDTSTVAATEVDAGQIQQVLTNLVLNSIQAMPEGGPVWVGIRVERTRPPADVGGPEDEYLCVSVQDRGPGVSPADLPKIFEPFFTTKDVGEGTGLGLSISRGIIHEHGGWIAVTSRPGEGARFDVYLPARSTACADAS